jgi:uncharacterized membrane protein YgdD (TMEM256/DUF423 family)
MAMPTPPIPRVNAWLAAGGALLAAIAVALGAYASHAAQGPAQARLQLAALFAFGHGLSLAALATSMPRGLGQAALAAMAIGVLLFSGSLAGAALAQWPTTLAPLGGMLMIGAWLALAVAFLRR